MRNVSVLLLLLFVSFSFAAEGNEIDAVSSASRQYNINGGTAYEDYADISWYAGYSNGRVFFSYGLQQNAYTDTVEFKDVSWGDHDEKITGLTPGKTYYFNLWASWYGKITKCTGSFVTTESGEVLFTVDVTNGTGGGEFEAGTTVTITAMDSTGYLFDAWTGDDDILSDATKESATFTMPEKNVSFTATYVEESVDTTNPSKEFIANQSWGVDIDSYGSEVDSGDALVTDNSIKATFTIVASDTGGAGTDDDKWAYGSVACWLPEDESTLEGCDYIKLTYKTNDKFELVLPQKGLADAGKSYNKALPATEGRFETVLWKLDDKVFSQPGWVSDKTELDLTKVEGLSFAMQNDGESGTIEIKEVVLYNYNGTYVSDVAVMGTTALQGKGLVIATLERSVTLTVPEEQQGTVRIVSTMGKVVLTESRLFSKGTHQIPTTMLSQGMYIVRFTGIDGTEKLVRKLFLK